MTTELRRLLEPGAVERLAHRVYTDEAARRFTGSPGPEGILELTQMWIERVTQKGWRAFEVLDRSQSVGLAGFGPVDAAAGHAYVSLYLDRPGAGVGTRATDLLAAAARTAGARSVRAITNGANAVARGVLEKRGFRLEGPSAAEWAVESGEDWVEYARDL